MPSKYHRLGLSAASRASLSFWHPVFLNREAGLVFKCKPSGDLLFLEGVEGQEEWRLKAMLDRKAATQWIAGRRTSGSAEGAPSPGLRYLKQRRAEADVTEAIREWLRQSCQEVAQSLRPQVNSQRQKEVYNSAETDDSPELVFNLRLLVPQRRRAELAKHIDEINVEREPQGLTLHLRGPWPPYSFCPELRSAG
jgi:hypothetical protein